MRLATLTAKCVPADNVKKMDGMRDGRLQFIKKVHPMNILTTTSLKIRKNFEKFTTLVRKYYSDSNADYILTYAKLLQGQVWDDWIDSRLAILRDIDKYHRLSQPR